MSTLAKESCAPCRAGDAALPRAQADALRRELKEGWAISADGAWLERRYAHKNFSEALAQVNKISAVADREDHHPDLMLGWGYVTVRLQTHSVGGLHRNDFILAAKIDGL